LCKKNVAKTETEPSWKGEKCKNPKGRSKEKDERIEKK